MDKIFIDEIKLNNYLQKILLYKKELENNLDEINRKVEEINLTYISNKNNILIEENIQLAKKNFEVLNYNTDTYTTIIVKTINRYEKMIKKFNNKIE